MKRHIFLLLLCGSAFAQKPTPATEANLIATPPARLIVRGDDMGFSHSGNLAMVEAYRNGIETSIEVIVPSPWFPEAVQLLKQIPDADVGIHLALTSEWDMMKWRPLTAAPSLVNADGYFYPMVFPNKNYPGQSISENKWKIEDVEREFRAQIEMALRHIPRISHVSAHMGCTDLSREVAALTRRLAKEYKIDIDPDDYAVQGLPMKGPSNTTAEKIQRFIDALDHLQSGKTYLYVEHPGLDNAELRAIHHVGYENVAEDRQAVTDLLTDPKVRASIEKKGIRLIGYRELGR